MTEFKPNITESIDNLNKANSDINVLNEKFKDVYSDETADFIDQVLEDNIDTKAGTSLELNNTVDKGKMEYKAKGNCEQDTIAYIDVGEWEQGAIDGTTGQNIEATTTIRTKDYIQVMPNVLYNISRTIKTSYMTFRFYASDKSYLGSQATQGIVTTNQPDNRMIEGVSTMEMTINNINVAYMRMTDSSNNLNTVYTISTQAPTPYYPQDIKVVTGENTITISNSDNSKSQEITVDLKTTELCKIGDYQDYIYGTKDNWKLVKQIGKVDLATHISWRANNNVIQTSLAYPSDIALRTDGQFAYCTRFTYAYYPSNVTTNIQNGQISWSGSKQITLKSESNFTTSDEFNTWLSTHSTILYYPLAESTETSIEDEDIIDDLNDLYDANFYAEQTNIAVTNATDLPLILDVTYFVTEKEE